MNLAGLPSIVIFLLVMCQWRRLISRQVKVSALLLVCTYCSVLCPSVLCSYTPKKSLRMEMCGIDCMVLPNLGTALPWNGWTLNCFAQSWAQKDDGGLAEELPSGSLSLHLSLFLCSRYSCLGAFNMDLPKWRANEQECGQKANTSHNLQSITLEQNPHISQSIFMTKRVLFVLTLCLILIMSQIPSQIHCTKSETLKQRRRLQPSPNCGGNLNTLALLKPRRNFHAFCSDVGIGRVSFFKATNIHHHLNWFHRREIRPSRSNAMVFGTGRTR